MRICEYCTKSVRNLCENCAEIVRNVYVTQHMQNMCEKCVKAYAEHVRELCIISAKIVHCHTHVQNMCETYAKIRFVCISCRLCNFLHTFCICFAYFLNLCALRPAHRQCNLQPQNLDFQVRDFKYNCYTSAINQQPHCPAA